MGVKLVDKSDPTTINMHDMKDGDIGEIVEWPISSYTGRIVQRYKQYLLCVGRPSEYGWGTLFNTDRDESCRVRILQPGELLEIA